MKNLHICERCEIRGALRREICGAKLRVRPHIGSDILPKDIEVGVVTLAKLKINSARSSFHP